MESRVPLPTDNIFKFYALFSLLLLIFSIGSSIYITKSSNEVLLGVAPEIIRLEQIKQPTTADQENKKLLTRKVDITISDRRTFIWGLGILSGLSVLGIAYGFTKWHKVIQPRQDRLLELQIQLADIQVQNERAKQLRREA